LCCHSIRTQFENCKNAKNCDLTIKFFPSLFSIAYTLLLISKGINQFTKMTITGTFKNVYRFVTFSLMLLSVDAFVMASDEQESLQVIDSQQIRLTSTPEEKEGKNDAKVIIFCVSTADELREAIQSSVPFIWNTISLCGNNIIYLEGSEDLTDLYVDLQCDSSECVLDGTDSDRIFTGSRVNLIMTGISVHNSNSSGGHGGAFYFENSDVTLTGCHFANNTSSRSGGAVYMRSSTLTLDDTVFEGNFASSTGGALYLARTSLLATSGFSSFLGNLANNAAALYMSSSTATMKDVFITGNVAETVRT
jgi:predicted outer membrane repeat protein